jgi:hypothetical protein
MVLLIRKPRKDQERRVQLLHRHSVRMMSSIEIENYGKDSKQYLYGCGGEGFILFFLESFADHKS